MVECSDAARLFTCLNVVVGASLAAAALALCFARAKRGRSRRAVAAALALWVAAGLAHGMLRERWSPARSLSYSITLLSTAGCEAPPTDDDFSLYFSGLFALSGVPLFGAVFSDVAASLEGLQI